MEQIRLFRKRFLPDEVVELRDDKILFQSEKLIITDWDVLKPRKDIAHGLSAYFLDLGVKVSKVYDDSGHLVYWYCDIVDLEIKENSYIFTDLLVDVLVYPDGHVEVLDLDEFADISEKDIIDKATCLKILRHTNALLKRIYSGQFSELTKCIDKAEHEKVAISNK